MYIRTARECCHQNLELKHHPVFCHYKNRTEFPSSSFTSSIFGQARVMGIIHTPRVFLTVAKGLFKQSSNPEIRARLGLADPHTYRSRAGVVDYAFGHLNNAAYLSHAEYARCAMMAENGWLNAMIKNRAMLVVVSQSCRYRVEIKPFLQQFEVESTVIGMEDRNMWL